jgi:hypothetical protein
LLTEHLLSLDAVEAADPRRGMLERLARRRRKATESGRATVIRAEKRADCTFLEALDIREDGSVSVLPNGIEDLSYGRLDPRGIGLASIA